MNDFKEKILTGIQKGEITPESKWRFLAHDYFFWCLAALSTILGAVAISSILHRIAREQLPPLAPYLRDPETISIFIQTLPFLWIGVLLLLGAAAWFNFKKTSGAYKHQLLVFLGMLIASMVIGGILFSVGIGGKVDEQVRERAPLFKKEFIKKQQIRQQHQERLDLQRKSGLTREEFKKQFPIERSIKSPFRR